MIEPILVPKSSHDQIEKQKQPTHGPIYFSTVQAIVDFDAESEAVAPAPTRSYTAQDFKLRSALLWKNNDKSLALHLLRQAVQRNPYDIDLISVLAEKLDHAQRYTEAIQVQNALVKILPNFQNLALLGHFNYKLGNDEQALQSYEAALEKLNQESVELFEVYKNLGNIFVRKGEFDLAEENYNKAYTLNPLSDVLLVNIGTLQIQQKDFEKSVYCFRKAISLNPNNDKAWVGLAMSHHEVGDLELSMANLKNALDLNPANRTAVHIYCAWAEKMSKRSEAIEHLQRYLSTVDEDQEMSLVLINLYCAKGQFDLAKIECKRVLCWNPQAKPVKYLLRQLSQGAQR